MASNEFLDRRIYDRRLFLWIAVGFAALVLAGFAQTYYLKPLIGAPELRTLTHVHGVVMTAWIVLFAVQVFLIRSRSLKLHMRLGFAGIVLASVVIVVGVATSIAAASLGSAASPADIPPLSFLIIPLGDILIFALLFAAAIFFRKRPAEHKRLMLVTVFNFLPAAVARIPIVPLQSLGPLWFFGFPDVLMLLILGYDTWKNGRLNRAFAIGAVLLIASHPFRLAVMESETWMAFATWITS